MKKSKEHSDNSTKPAKTELESKRSIPNTENGTQTKHSIMSRIIDWGKKWGGIVGIIVISISAGIGIENLRITLDDRIDSLKQQIENLNKEKENLSNERNVLSDHMGILEQKLQHSNHIIDSLKQNNNTLIQDLQNVTNEFNNLTEENNRLNKKIDSLSRVPPKTVETFEVTILFHGFSFQTLKFKIFLNGKLKGVTTEDNYTLSEEEGVYNLKIQYKDNANRIWEYSDSIIFNGTTSELPINKSKFNLKH
ncbi:MAG: hypothetical protein IH852_05345 [Bacteroidetes bacterium]|nr:hypothetical protein [Bacteroidota bacterium]